MRHKFEPRNKSSQHTPRRHIIELLHNMEGLHCRDSAYHYEIFIENKAQDIFGVLDIFTTKSMTCFKTLEKSQIGLSCPCLSINGFLIFFALSQTIPICYKWMTVYWSRIKWSSSISYKFLQSSSLDMYGFLSIC